MKVSDTQDSTVTQWGLRWVESGKTIYLPAIFDSGLDDAIEARDVFVKPIEEDLGYVPKHEIVQRTMSVTYSDWSPAALSTPTEGNE